MADKLIQIENPLTGQRIVFRRTAEQTGGELAEMDMFYQPGGRVDHEHAHPIQEEQFEVISGMLRFVVGGREQVAGPGETLVVPPRTLHTFANIGEGVAQVRVTYRPALRSEQFFESYFGLAQEGKLDPKTHMPGLFQLAALVRAFRNEIQPAAVSPLVSRLVLAPLAVVARLLGYRAPYPYPRAAARTAAEGGL